VNLYTVCCREAVIQTYGNLKVSLYSRRIASCTQKRLVV